VLSIVLAGVLLPASSLADQTAVKPAGASKPVPVDTFVGVWRLVSFENIDEQGQRTPGNFSEGRIMYDAHGNMAAQLMRPGRPAHSSSPSEAERSASYSSYVAYYGRYELDAATSKVTHHVEGALNPNWVKTQLVRYWEFSPDGQRLSLSIRNSAGRATGTLVWEKIR
jgi:hypothetical protein